VLSEFCRYSLTFHRGINGHFRVIFIKLKNKKKFGLENSTFLWGMLEEFVPLKVYFMWPECDKIGQPRGLVARVSDY
jgi:hypothetical protein